jgi:CheY-like chemotaxis protein
VATTAHILLADRDPALRRVLTHRLEAEGLAVRSFEDRTIPSSSAYESTRACRPSVDRRWVPQYVFDGLTIDPADARSSSTASRST